MNKAIFISSLFVLLMLTISCQQDITELEAIQLTKDFINEQVKFFVNDENSSPIVNQAEITTLKTEKKQGIWTVYLNIKSGQNNKTKEANIIIRVDAKTGKVLGPPQKLQV